MDIYDVFSGLLLIYITISTLRSEVVNAEELFIRVIDGENGNKGRLEIYDTKELEWLPVCRTKFTDANANVVCRMLGYTNVKGRAIKVEGSGSIWKRHLECTGNEAFLSQCTVTDVNVGSKCDYVGVDCSECGSPEGFFILGGYGYIFRMDDSTLAYIQIPKNNTRIIYGLSFDFETNSLFWSDLNTIRKLEVASGEMQTLFTSEDLNIVNSRGLALDSSKRLLFYSDRSMAFVGKVNLENLKDRVVILKSAKGAQHLVIDPDRGKIYWVETSNRLLKEADYNGANQRKVVSNDALKDYTTMFTLDDHYVYIASALANAILVHGRYNDSSHSINISMYSLYRSITQWNDYLFLTSAGQSQIIRIHKYGHSVELFGPTVLRYQHVTNIMHYPTHQDNTTATTPSPFETTEPTIMDFASSLPTTSTTASPFVTTNPTTMASTSSTPTTAMYTTQESIVETTTTEMMMPVPTDEITTPTGTVTTRTTSESSFINVGDEADTNTGTVAIAGGVGAVALILGVVLGVLIYRRCSSNSPPGKELYMTPLSKSLVGQDNAAYDQLKPATTAQAAVYDDGYVEPVYTVIKPENETQSTPAVTNNSTPPDGESTDPHIYLELNPEPSSNTNTNRNSIEGHARVF